ncbi:TniQ family protein [Scytonema hofmannii]|uniref:TniQ family protein n=1 Tax=Scytonema hofmannii TaxID=34078 RepID=UPI0009D6E50C|nr:TniQ family protein [Scytonema hofmannii]
MPIQESLRCLLRHKRAWCPFCYQEWRDNSKSIYEPLIWCINVVEICPIHNHTFVSVCPHCLTQPSRRMCSIATISASNMTS